MAVTIIEGDNMARFAKEIAKNVKEIIEEEKKGYEPYLSTNQLAEVFPYEAKYFREKINQGAFGKKARNGDCMAKYKEVYDYLFNSEK